MRCTGQFAARFNFFNYLQDECIERIVVQEPYNDGYEFNRRLGMAFLPIYDRPEFDA